MVSANILCADYGHDAVVSTQVLDLLPDLVHIRGRSDGGLVEDTVRLLGRELATPQMATGIVLDRLIDVLLVQVLRAWLASSPQQDPSWLGALSDDVVGRAVTRLHEDAARAWTTATLARETGVSRATLARRFGVVTARPVPDPGPVARSLGPPRPRRGSAPQAGQPVMIDGTSLTIYGG